MADQEHQDQVDAVELGDKSAPFPWNRAMAQLNRDLDALMDHTRTSAEARKLYRAFATHQTSAYSLYQTLKERERKAAGAARRWVNPENGQWFPNDS